MCSSARGVHGASAEGICFRKPICTRKILFERKNARIPLFKIEIGPAQHQVNLPAPYLMISNRIPDEVRGHQRALLCAQICGGLEAAQRHASAEVEFPAAGFNTELSSEGRVAPGVATPGLPQIRTCPH